VRAVDVSDANDWSAVRVWYAPIQGLGTTHWPVDGFIYNRPAHAPAGSRSLGTGATLRLASASASLPARQTLMAKRAPAAAVRQPIGADFLSGVPSEGVTTKATVTWRARRHRLPPDGLRRRVDRAPWPWPTIPSAASSPAAWQRRSAGRLR
jgi:hypothetical protein